MASWLESYQDLLGQFISSDTTTTPATTTTTTTTPAPRSLLMSLIGDFIPYITGAEGGEGAAGRGEGGEGGTDPGDGLGDSEDGGDSDGDQILRRQGLAFDTRGGPRKRWEN